MKTIDKIPGTPEIKTCEKHGDYEVKYSRISETRCWVFDSCRVCIDESDAQAKITEEKENKARTIEIEKQRRERVRVNAGISKRNLYKTFDDYKCDNEGQAKAKNDCERFVKEFPCEKSMIMVGGVGTGKTLLASAVVDALIDNNKCEMIKVIDLIRHLKSTWSKDSEDTEEDIIKYFIKLDLLILDEVGSQFGSDTEKLFIFDIIT